MGCSPGSSSERAAALLSAAGAPALRLSRGELVLREDGLVRIGRPTGRARIEPQPLHVRRRLLPARVEELLGVVAAGVGDVALPVDDVAGQVQRQEVRLLIMAA